MSLIVFAFACVMNSHAQIIDSNGNQISESADSSKVKKLKPVKYSDEIKKDYYNTTPSDTQKTKEIKQKKPKPVNPYLQNWDLPSGSDTVNIKTDEIINSENTSTPADTTTKPKKKMISGGHYEIKPEEDSLTTNNQQSDSDTTGKPIKHKTKNDNGFNIELEPEHEMVMDTTLIPIHIPTTDEIAYDLLQQSALFMNNGKYIDAKLLLDSITRFYPGTSSFGRAFFYRAQCKVSFKDYTGAVQDLNTFLLLDSCSSGLCSAAAFTHGFILFQQKEYEQAITYFTQAAQDSDFENLKMCYYYRATSNGELGKNIQAVQDFTKFLAIDNLKTLASAEALYTRGFYKMKLNDNRGAVQDYSQAIELYTAAMQNPKLPNKNMYLQKLIDTYISRGLAKSDIGKYDESILDYNQVIKLNDSYALAYRLRGLAEINQNNKDAGCLDLSHAGELGSNDAYDDIQTYCK